MLMRRLIDQNQQEEIVFFQVRSLIRRILLLFVYQAIQHLSALESEIVSIHYVAQKDCMIFQRRKEFLSMKSH